MAETERSLQQAYSFFRYGTPDRPQVILPNPSISEPIVIAQNLASCPQVLDALPRRSDGQPASYHASVEQLVPSDPQEIIQPVIKKQVLPSEDTVTKKFSSDLVVFTFSDPNAFLQNARQTDRGLQRTFQYEKLLGLITDSEWKLQQGKVLRRDFTYTENGVARSFAIQITPDVLHALKTIAVAFYADELVKEQLTQRIAKDTRTRMILQEEAVVKEAERIVFDNRRADLTDVDVEVKRTEVVNQTNQPTIQDSEKSDKKEETAVTAASTQGTPADDSKKETDLDEKDVLQAVEELLRLDCPSKKAAQYLEELWKRAF